MARVLYLHDLRPDFQTERAVLNLRRDLGQDALVYTIGHGGDFRHVVDAVFGLRRMRSQPIDIIHAWGPTALTAATLAGWPRIVHSPNSQIGIKGLKWLRAVSAHTALEIVCATATQQRILVEHGLSAARCHLIRPGVDFSLLRRRKNPELRAELGFGDSDFVLLAVGESTHASSHRMAVWAAGILNEMDQRTKIMTWGRGGAVDHTNRFAGRLLQDGLYTCAEAKLGRPLEFEELTTVADAGLITACGSVATLPICICMGAGLPMISTVTYTVAELLEDRHSALMVPKPSPRAIAERVIDLRQDNELRWRITDAAKTEAFEYFSLTRFLDQWRTAYRQMMEAKPIEIPPIAPGAGTRFGAHG